MKIAFGKIGAMKHKIYIAIGSFCWGRGLSKDDAIRNCRKAKPAWVKWRKPKVYECHPETTVTGMGGLEFPTGHEPKLVAE